MIRIDQDKIKPFWKHLEKNKIFTVKELALLLKCSIPNARLKLKRWKVYTSYNQNGRFYTLPQVPNFDDYGLWHYKKVSFSKNGNLKKTIVHLVSSSPAGFTGKELGVLVGLIPQSFVHHLRNYPGISREKHDGVFVYFSDETPVYKNQVAQRISLNYRSIVVNISDIEAVIILVAIIKHHGISAEDILTLPEIKNSNIKLKAILLSLKLFDLDHSKKSGFDRSKSTFHIPNYIFSLFFTTEFLFIGHWFNKYFRIYI